MDAEAAVSERISIGIAGWSYDDWNGYVYPRGTRDKLRYIAPYVDMVEVNSTFYRPPYAKTVASWVNRTSDLGEFYFAAKLHQDITHRGEIAPGMVRAIRDGFAPMIQAGKLRHLLAQFRYDFAESEQTRIHLQRIASTFGGMSNLVLELRHNSWQSPAALEFLSSLGVTVANLDYPTARDSFNLYASGVGEHAYMRLHGRNARAWFSKQAGRDETYNYAYSREELDQIADRAVKIAGMSKSLTLVANNHYQGKEAMNALEIKARVTGRKVDVPPELLKRYPRLQEIARNLPEELPLG